MELVKSEMENKQFLNGKIEGLLTSRVVIVSSI